MPVSDASSKETAEELHTLHKWTITEFKNFAEKFTRGLDIRWFSLLNNYLLLGTFFWNTGWKCLTSLSASQIEKDE